MKTKTILTVIGVGAGAAAAWWYFRKPKPGPVAQQELPTSPVKETPYVLTPKPITSTIIKSAIAEPEPVISEPLILSKEPVAVASTTTIEPVIGSKTLINNTYDIIEKTSTYYDPYSTTYDVGSKYRLALAGLLL